MSNYMTTQELAEYYNVSRQSVDKWRRNGMPYQRLSNRIFRYKLSDVEQFFKNKGSERAEKVNV